MLRTALSTAALAVFALTTQAQQGPIKPAVTAGKAIDTAGKAVLPIGPRLAGEEKLTAQERAERTFLMPPRKKMPSVQPAPPQLDPASPEAVAIGTPAAEEAADEAKTEAAKPAATTHHSSVRRHRSTRSHSTSSRKKSSTKKKSSSSTKRRSSRR